MSLLLSPEERKVFINIAYIMADGKSRTPKQIKGAAVPKDKMEYYMKYFASKNLLYCEGGHYRLSNLGNIIFERLIDSKMA